MGADETATEGQEGERTEGEQWRKVGKNEGKWKKRKIKSREGCWVGSGEKAGKRTA